jgi:hypothetical protein
MRWGITVIIVCEAEHTKVHLIEFDVIQIRTDADSHF